MGIDVTFKSNIPEIIKKMDSTARARMNEAVQEVRNKTLVKLSGSRKDDPERMYRVPGTKKLYQASSPGQPPAQATGELRQSIKGEVKQEGKQVVGRVGTPLKYGNMLEFGTVNMAARPWLRKSFEEAEAKVKEIYTRIWF